MRDARRSYVHRGDQDRRSNRIRYGIILAGALVALVAAVREHGPSEASGMTLPLGRGGEPARLRMELDAAKGQLELANAQIARWHRIFNYSSHFHIPADLAGAIYDVALAEGIEPEIAFRLVRVESEFNERATSKVGAVGLTQLMPATARYFDKSVTREQLYDRELNLRIGFRYLRTLLREYKGNARLALLVYNRGPQAVEASRDSGDDPSNGYDRVIMKGFKGKVTVD
jgi:soluble lytic murein transglycosylase-like protein